MYFIIMIKIEKKIILCKNEGIKDHKPIVLPQLTGYICNQAE